MSRTIGVVELQEHFDSVLHKVAEEHVPYVLTRDSRPEAALIPYEEFLRFQAFREKEVLDLFQRAQARMTEKNAGYSDEEIAADVQAARNECPD
ncbi:MAG TPA: type II toxin-antitoxin system Phd/YefM family antitoxin [Thermoanaerobaculia bacterium]|nr:type II toxin-antitoxin system Phd/YefM family antitoxin [Thermoanaerobaculia bacterium]